MSETGKPVGPIPAGYETRDGELAVDGETASQLVERAGRTPRFVYSSAMMSRRVADLRAAMPERLKINYAIKANSFAPVLAHMAGLVDGLDIASGGELDMVRNAGIDCARVSFAGPG